MMKYFACLLILLSLNTQALQVIVWDRDLQTKLGYGVVSANKLNVQLVSDYSGPVVTLFARESSEKNLYSDLQDRYDGVLKAGQLSLKDDKGQNVNLAKLLSGYKIALVTQANAQSVSLPGLKSASDTKPKTP